MNKHPFRAGCTTTGKSPLLASPVPGRHNKEHSVIVESANDGVPLMLMLHVHACAMRKRIVTMSSSNDGTACRRQPMIAQLTRVHVGDSVYPAARCDSTSSSIITRCKSVLAILCQALAVAE